MKKEDIKTIKMISGIVEKARKKLFEKIIKRLEKYPQNILVFLDEILK